MRKSEAINLLGGNVRDAAKALGVSYNAVNKLPDVLSRRVADRVIGACVRNGIEVPPKYAADLAEPERVA